MKTYLKTTASASCSGQWKHGCKSCVCTLVNVWYMYVIYKSRLCGVFHVTMIYILHISEDLHSDGK